MGLGSLEGLGGGVIMYRRLRTLLFISGLVAGTSSIFFSGISQARMLRGLHANFGEANLCKPVTAPLLSVPTQTWVETMGSASSAIAGLEAQGFRCCANPIPSAPGTPDNGCVTSYSIDTGVTCIGKLSSYPKPVALVIPPHYKPEKEAELVAFLHGNNPSNVGLSYFLEKLDLAKSLATSKRNSILVFPASGSGSSSQTEDYDTFFPDAAKVDQFFAETGQVLAKAKLAITPSPGNIVLSGHSGAYRGITQLLSGSSSSVKKIKEVYCLDCMYWNHSTFVDFAKAPGNRLWAVTTPKGDTYRGSSCVQHLLDEKGISYFGCRTLNDTCPAPDATTGPAGSANSVCTIEERRSSFNREDFGKNRIGFVHSEVSHEDVVERYLPTLLGGGF